MGQATVTGAVVDSAGEAVVGATVVVAGAGGIGTVTDVDGWFSFVVPEGTRELTVSYVGMLPQTVAVTSTPMHITLLSAAKSLDEVMVVAFGTAKKSAYTGSATVVDAEVLSLSQVSAVTNALSGVVPGLQLTSTDGAPGSTSTIRIRGFSSINAGNNPLIVVDGAPYDGDLNSINPVDVESLSVLKDAASNALYGARGANGVIMITTKGGSNKGATITVDAKWGSNSNAMPSYKTITDPAQYYETHYSALNQYYLNSGYSAAEAWQMANATLCGEPTSGGLGYNIWTYPDGQYLIGSNGKLNPNATLGRVVNYRGEDYYITPDDWSAEATRPGLRQEYNVTFSQASDKNAFYASFGYLNNDGYIEHSSQERLTGRIKADATLTKWLKVGANISYTHSTTDVTNSREGGYASTENVWYYTMFVAPIYPLYIRNGDGSIRVDSNGIKMMDYGGGDNAGLTRAFLSNSNAIQASQLDSYINAGNASTGSAYAKFTILDGLSLTVNGSYTYDDGWYTETLNPYYDVAAPSGGTVNKENTKKWAYNLQQLINYSTSFGRDHNLDVMVGHEYYTATTSYLTASGGNMFSADIHEIGATVVDQQTASSYKDRYNNEGFFGRIQYNYREKYFGSVSLREDASSRFHPDHRWGTFWSVGAAWQMTKESFLSNVPWLDELKVKASYGVQGNDNIDQYMYTDQYNIVNSAGNIGTAFHSKGTQDITWEKNGNVNIGVEFSFLNRIRGSIEYYYRLTRDMLFQYSVPLSLGYDSYWANVGDMYNTGVEIALDVDVVQTKNVTWNVHANLSTVKNRITKVSDALKSSTRYDMNGKAYYGFDSDYFFIGEGLSIYTWRLRESAGIDQTTGQELYYMSTYDSDGNYTGRTTTTNGYSADYLVTHKSTVPPVFGGFGTTLRAYGFDLSVNFSYQLGGAMYDVSYQDLMTCPSSMWCGYAFHADVMNAWTADNPSATMPRFVYGDTPYMSTRYLTSARYLNIDNINVGYTFPERWMKRAAIRSLRVYVACENVAFFSARQGFDPRQTYSYYSDATYYSPMRTISGGLTLTF